MAVKSRSLFLALLFISMASISYALGGRAGGWQPIKSPISAQVVEIAKFAVAEHNSKSKSALVFESVLSGEQQVVSGMNYKLVISAKDGAAANKYQAVVYVKPWEKLRELTSFQEIRG